MKNPLNKRILREIKGEFGKYVVIFLFMTALIGIVSGFLVADQSLTVSYNQSFEKYVSEFDTIPEFLKDKRVTEADRTPAENLAYQVGWTALFLKWEADEKQGIEAKTPSERFKWNQLGDLYQWFTAAYAHLSLTELKDQGH